ncbi:hypothetical protein [Prosthecochloris sp.]|uniref:hypothetical protein n=1 Tax=Prosthecochloris sp. TaxID=290513 RepID=UPI0025E931BA|nr:hypothetical protein [Prosthecochloris sp.]
MAVTAEDIKMRIVAENAADKAVKQFATSIKNVDKNVGILGGSLKALGGIAVGAFAVQGIRKFNDFVTDSIKLAQTQQDAEKKVADVIRATGGAAGYAAEEIKAMASSLQNQTAFGDEAILEMQSILLTFKNVSDDVFSGASMAVLDMATVMQTDLKSAAIQLGKALNDPVLGASAMSRAGIQFTEAQKKMMKKMVATNRIAEAQKMILDEIAGQMGGSAAGAADTYSGKIDQLSNRYGDMKEQIGFAVMESGAFDRVLDTLNPAVDELTKYIVDHKDDIGDFAEHLAKMGSDVVKNAPGYIDAIAKSAEGVYDKVKPLIDFALENPDVIEYGIIGALVFGKKGAAIGGFIASLDTFVDSDKGDRMKENWARKQQGLKPMTDEEWDREINWLEYRESESKFKSPFRGDSAIKEMMGLSSKQIMTRFRTSFEEAAEASAKVAEEQKKLSKASGNTAGKVNDLGSVTGDAEKRQREVAKALESAEQWYRKEYEAIEGLTSAKDAEKLAVDNLTLLYGKGKISFDEFIGGLDDAAFKLDYFKASMDGTFQADIDSMIKNRPDLFGTQQYEVFGSSFFGTEANRESVEEGLYKADKQIEALYMIGDSLDVMGYDLQGAGNFATAIEQLTLASKLDEIPGADPTNARVRAIGNLLIGTGQTIGGDVGDALSSTAGMALAGMEIAGGNPIGAVIGGVIGLAGSLFGGDDEREQARQQREQARMQVYDSIVQSALSGGTFSAELLSKADYTYAGVANLHDPGYPGHDSTYGRLLKDRSQEELPELTEFISSMDEIGMAMDAVTKTSLESSLERLSIKYEYLAKQVEGYADVLDAQWAETAATLLGITADSTASMFASAIETAEDADHAGRLIAESLEEQIVESIKQMAISQAVNEAVMPMMQPILNELVAGALSGGLTAKEMADLVLQAQDVAASVAPAVSALYGAFDAAGVMEASSYAGSSYNAETPATIEFREKGGPVSAGQSYIVGERRPELFIPRSDGYITPFVPTAADMSHVVAELRALRNERQSVTLTIDGQQFRAFLEKNRVKAEKRIAAGLSRTLRQEF